jgi:hypothetical protein
MAIFDLRGASLLPSLRDDLDKASLEEITNYANDLAEKNGNCSQYLTDVIHCATLANDQRQQELANRVVVLASSICYKKNDKDPVGNTLLVSVVFNIGCNGTDEMKKILDKAISVNAEAIKTNAIDACEKPFRSAVKKM